MNTMYTSIKNHYDAKRYDNDRVKVFVKVNWITEDEYKEITGDVYTA